MTVRYILEEKPIDWDRLRPPNSSRETLPLKCASFRLSRVDIPLPCTKMRNSAKIPLLFALNLGLVSFPAILQQLNNFK